MKKGLKILTGISVLALLLAGVALAQGGIPGSGWWSGDQVQNVGGSTANIVISAYTSGGSQVYQNTTTLGAGASTTFIPTNFTGMPDGFIGSAVVSSDQPIKAIVNVTNLSSGSFGVPGGKAAAQYQGTESTATSLYFPLAKNNRFGKTTAFYIQNAGTAAATAQVTFRMDDGNTYNYTTPSIPANRMVLVTPSNANVPTSNTNRANIGSAQVTSAQPLAGTVMEYTVGEAVATVLQGTRGFTSNDFDDKAYAPVVKNNRFGRFTGIQVQNVSGGSINVTVSYKGTSSNCLAVNVTDTFNGLANNASKTFVNLTGQSNFPNNCTGSATITATGNFVAIVNEANMTGSPTAGITYSAMPDNSATTKVSIPLFKDRRFGFSSGLQIQNVGVNQANAVFATFTCKGNNGANTPFTAITTAQTIPAGGAKLFYRPASMPAGTFQPGNPFSFQGANCGVTVTSDRPIVAIVNETPDTAGALDDNNYEGFNLAP
jgi:hypothetical protein